MKRLFFIALAAVALAACGDKDDPNPSGNGNVIPTEPTDPPAIEAPYILYYDAPSQSLAAGKWRPKGRVNVANILRFKFGSVVGFTVADANDKWNSADVKFNPTGVDYEDYTTIPMYTGEDGVGAGVDGYLSSEAWHSAVNVQTGKGDPCRLVGLRSNATAEEIAAHDSGLRLPTDAEFREWYAPEVEYPDPEGPPVFGPEKFVWTTTPANGRWLANDRTAASFLPVVYYRSGNGNPSSGSVCYWSSFPGVIEETDITNPYGTGVGVSKSATGILYSTKTYGYPIRCTLD
jgi:hypothetical protein